MQRGRSNAEIFCLLMKVKMVAVEGKAVAG